MTALWLQSAFKRCYNMQSSDTVGLYSLIQSSVQDLHHFAIYFNEKTSQNALPSDFVPANQKAAITNSIKVRCVVRGSK